MVKTRVLIVENTSLLNGRLAGRVSQLPRIASIATSSNALDSPKARRFHPDVVLLNPCLRNQDTLEALETIKAACPGARIVVLDIRPVEVDLLRLVKAGASGFVVKDATLGDLVRTIHSVAEGGKVLPPELAEVLFSQISDVRRGQLPSSMRMTRREQQIIELIAEGLSNHAIAQRLDIATHTVKTHVHSILAKMGLRTRLEVAVYAGAGCAPRDVPTS